MNFLARVLVVICFPLLVINSKGGDAYMAL